MSLFDIVGQVAGAVMNPQNAEGEAAGGLLGMVGNLLNNPETGGLQGLVDKFQSSGLGDAVASWVSTGENQAVSGEQIQGALGSEQIQAIASKLGIPPEIASSQLAQMLPDLINKLTPNGAIPEGGLLQQGLSLLLGRQA
jgi:uncharacterized protein YidB (DUF937 family)